MHGLRLVTLSELKIAFLDSQRKEAKREKEENIDLYVREYMGRPLEKIHVSGFSFLQGKGLKRVVFNRVSKSYRKNLTL